MRFVLLSIVFATLIFAKSSIGFGAIKSTSIYKETNKDTPTFIPYFNYANDSFYIKGLEVGYRLYQSENLNINTILQLRLQSFTASDSTIFHGMESREKTLEYGFKIKYRPIFFLNTEIKSLFDLLEHHKGNTTSLKLSTLFKPNDKTLIFPFVSRTYLSKNFVNYYYGVQKNEVNSQREYYKPNSSYKNSIGANFIYKITPTTSISLLINYSKYEKEVTNSPLVKKDNKTTYITAISYKF